MSYIHLTFCRKLADSRLSELDSTEVNSEIDQIEFEHVSFNLQINDNLCINASSKALCGVVGQEEFMLFIKSLVRMSTRLQRAHFYVYFSRYKQDPLHICITFTCVYITSFSILAKAVSTSKRLICANR